MKQIALMFLMLIMACGSSAFAAEQSYSGTWQNFKFKTSGPLQCTATTTDGKAFKGNFTGKFMGDPFEYNVEFTGTKNDEQVDLKGTARLNNGGQYSWTGYIRGGTFFGKFRSTKGYFGEFTMKQK